MVDVECMERRNRKLEALKQQILAAHAGLGFGHRLIQDIAEHSQRRREEGRTPAYIAQELGISEWQAVDWMHEATHERHPRPEEGEERTPLMFECKVPLTRRLERLLVREVARAAQQQCERCSWRRFVKGLPDWLKSEKRSKQS